MNLFPKRNKPVVEKVAERWDLSKPLPIPKWNIECPACGDDKTQVRHWIFHKRRKERTQSQNPYRCDIAFKCTFCSHHIIFCLVIPEEMYKRFEDTTIHWRQAKKILE